MEITEVRIKLTENGDDKLRAFCSITINNEFVIRDLKVIEGTKGMFVAMPSRKLTVRCSKCGEKNHLRASFCNGCGTKQNSSSLRRDLNGRVKLHADIAHPINSDCRECIQSEVLDAFQNEIIKSQQPGYKPKRIFEDEEINFDDSETQSQTQKSQQPDDNFGGNIFD